MTVEQPFLSPSLSDEHWKFVEDLIRDVEEDERQERFLKALFSWWSAVRAFRRVEIRHMRQAEASTKDLRWHACCLAALIAIGESLTMEICSIKKADVLEAEGVCRSDVEAAVELLRHNWTEWHAQPLPERVDALKRRLGLDAS